MGRDVKNHRKWQRAYRVFNKKHLNEGQRRRHAAKRAAMTEAQKETKRRRERERYKGIEFKVYHAIRTKRYRLKLKTNLINAYGGKCTCCGEKDHGFLTLEHKNGDGKVHRAKFASLGAYRDIRDRGYPKKYTVLCFNCNIAKSLYGRCPHKVKKRR